jgi:ACS family tartrate transporter-like MFS transporter
MLTNYVLGRPLDKKSSTSDAIAVLLTAIPYAAAAVWQMVFSWHSQYRQEKRWHVVGSWGGAAVCMFLLPTAMGHSPTAGFAVFIVATMLVYGAFSISSSYIMQLLGGERGMGGAIQNSLGNLGGFVGPYVIGALKDATGSYFPAMYTMGAGLSLACIIVAIYNPHWSEKKAMPNMHLQEDYDKSKRAESGLPLEDDGAADVTQSSTDQKVKA